jgi:hypothetical protein
MGLFVTLMYAQLGTSHAGSCADTIGKVTNVAAKVKSTTKAIADSFDLFFHVFIFFHPQILDSFYVCQCNVLKIFQDIRQFARVCSK